MESIIGADFFEKNVGGVYTIANFSRIQLHRLQVENVGLIQFHAPQSVKRCQLIVSRSELRVELDGCTQAAFYEGIIARACGDGYRGVVVVGEITLRIELDGLLIPSLRGSEVSCSKF